MQPTRPPLLPEQIHPALWRGSQLACRAQDCLDSGHPALNRELPGGGWPLGSLIELMPMHPGIGEIRLLMPALRRLAGRPVALVAPPQPPHIACWTDWGLMPAQLLWLRTQRPADTLWAAEQILRHDSCGALLCWTDAIRHDALRRLHLSAQSGRTLFFLLRPAHAGVQPSPAPLRLALAPAGDALDITLLKRRGPACARPIRLALDPGLSALASPYAHEPLDRPAPAQPRPGRLAPTLAG